MKSLLAALGIMFGAIPVVFADDIPGNTSTKAVLPLGSKYTHGIFDTSSDVDWYKLTLEPKGQHFAIQLRQDASARLIVYNSKGKEVTKNSCDTDASCFLEFNAPYAGVYFVGVSKYEGGPDYYLRAAKDCASDIITQCRTIVGKIAQGNIFSSGDTDYWQVNLVKDKRYGIKIIYTETVSEDFQDYLFLKNASGDIVKDQDFIPPTTKNRISIIKNFKATYTGSYLIGVIGYYTGGANYKVAVTER